MIELYHLAPDFGFLLERGLRNGARSSANEGPGGVLELDGDEVSFRFSGAAYVTSVSIRSPGGIWYDLGDVLDFLGRATNPREQARVLEACWNEITALFSDPMRVADLEDHVAAIRTRTQSAAGRRPS